MRRIITHEHSLPPVRPLRSAQAWLDRQQCACRALPAALRSVSGPSALPDRIEMADYTTAHARTHARAFLAHRSRWPSGGRRSSISTPSSISSRVSTHVPMCLWAADPVAQTSRVHPPTHPPAPTAAVGGSLWPKAQRCPVVVLVVGVREVSGKFPTISVVLLALSSICFIAAPPLLGPRRPPRDHLDCCSSPVDGVP
jgi:hypothetical protein